MVNSNNAINSLPTVQMSLGIVALLGYMIELILTVISVIGEDVRKCCFSKVYDVKSVWQPCLETIIDFKCQKQGSLGSFRPRTGWDLHCFVLSVNSLKGDLSNATTFNRPLFSSSQYF
jgi:hypothetical protein